MSSGGIIRAGPAPRDYTNKVDIRIEIPNVEGIPMAGEILTMKDLKDDLVAVSTSKGLHDPTGHWKLTFTARVVSNGLRWDQLIPPYSLVTIKFWRPQMEAEQAVMLGLSETQIQDENYAAAGFNRTSGIAGSDMATVLHSFKLYWLLQSENLISDAFLGAKDRIKGYILDPEFLTENQPASKIVGKLLNKYIDAIQLRLHEPSEGPGRTAQRTFSPVSRLIRYDVRHFVDFDEDAKYPIPVSFLHTGSLWSILRRFSESTFHEMFVDTDPGGEFCEFVHRPKPFKSGEDEILLETGDRDVGLPILVGEQDSLFSTESRSETDRQGRARVQTTVALTNDIIQWSVSRGVTDMYNLFWVLPRFELLTEQGFKAQLLPEIIDAEDNPSDLNRFGLRPMEVRVPYMPFSATELKIEEERESNLARLINVYQRWQQILANWYGSNPLLYSGTLRLKGRASFRVGDRLVAQRPDGIYEFYIEKVDQMFNVQSGHFVSTLKVTRGFKSGTDIAATARDMPPEEIRPVSLLEAQE